jgi:hypothetical protein
MESTLGIMVCFASCRSYFLVSPRFLSCADSISVPFGVSPRLVDSGIFQHCHGFCACLRLCSDAKRQKWSHRGRIARLGICRQHGIGRICDLCASHGSTCAWVIHSDHAECVDPSCIKKSNQWIGSCKDSGTIVPFSDPYTLSTICNASERKNQFECGGSRAVSRSPFAAAGEPLLCRSKRPSSHGKEGASTPTSSPESRQSGPGENLYPRSLHSAYERVSPL